MIKQLAAELGFSFCGIAKATKLDDDARRLETWLNKGMHGSMKYMERYFDMRIDPSKLVPGARSVITLLLNYFPKEKQNSDALKISKYAYGKDYHEVIKEKLNTLLGLIKQQCWQHSWPWLCRQCPGIGKNMGAAQRAWMGWQKWKSDQ